MIVGQEPGVSAETGPLVKRKQRKMCVGCTADGSLRLSLQFLVLVHQGGDKASTDASWFEPSVVRAALDFSYLGLCRQPLEDIGALYALADYWSFSLLADAVLRRVAVKGLNVSAIHKTRTTPSLDPRNT